ncbi:hypothetical protein G6F57_018752 [Rhizopus arrhizus]|nr:hypothetical protein G6F57_018752 [Rhizopus arrhizus]
MRPRSADPRHAWMNRRGAPCGSACRYRMRRFAGGREAHIRRTFLRQLQVDPGRRQVDQVAGRVQRQVQRVLLAELFQLLLVAAVDPTRGGHADRLEGGFHAVLVLQAIGGHVELQHAHRTQDQVVAAGPGPSAAA